MSTPATRLAKALDLLGLSQTEVARSIKVSPAYISHITKGRRPPTERILEDLESVVGISQAWVMEGRPPVTVQPTARYLPPPTGDEVREPAAARWRAEGGDQMARLVSAIDTASLLARTLRHSIGDSGSAEQYAPPHVHALLDDAFASLGANAEQVLVSCLSEVADAEAGTSHRLLADVLRQGTADTQRLVEVFLRGLARDAGGGADDEPTERA